MFVARLICSDEACAEAHELEAGSVEELERIACECGCVLEVIGWPDWLERGSAVVALPVGRGAPPLRAAA